MKLIVRTLVLCLTVSMLLLSFAGCAGRENVIEAYNQAGYATAEYVTVKDEEIKEYAVYLPDVLKEENTEIECRYFMADNFIEDEKTKIRETLSSAVFVKFASEDELKATLGEEAYQKQQTEGNIRGSWLLVYASNEAAEDTFEKYTIFEPMAFVDNAIYMGAGMLGIFVVIGLIIITTYILNSATASKKKEQ